MPSKPIEFQGRAELRQTFADIQKAQKAISIWNDRIAQKDPFSPKHIRASQQALTKWNAVEREKLKLLSQNDKIIKELTKSEKRYSDVSIEGIRIQQEKMARVGYKSALSYRIRQGRKEADRLAFGLDGAVTAEGGERGAERAGIIDDIARRFGRMVIAAAVSKGTENLTAGWSFAKSMQKFTALGGTSVLRGPISEFRGGEAGGYRRWGSWRTGSFVPTPGQPKKGFRVGLLDPSESSEFLTSLEKDPVLTREGISPADVMAMTARLRGSGISFLDRNGQGYKRAVDEAKVASVLTTWGRMDEGQIYSWKSTAARGGGTTSANRLVNIAAQAESLGMSGARAGEYMDTITNLMEAAQQTAHNTDPDEFAKAIYRINVSGGSGLRGALGGQVALSLQTMMQAPGGGKAGQLLMLRAMGFGPGGKSFTEASMQAEKGLTGENLTRVLNMYKSTGNIEMAMWALHLMSDKKISLTKAKELIEGRGGGGGGGMVPSYVPEGQEMKWLNDQQKSFRDTSTVGSGTMSTRGVLNVPLHVIQGVVSSLMEAVGLLKKSVDGTPADGPGASGPGGN